MRTILYICCLHYLFLNIATAQPGCKDPQALNYAPAATINDGSCLYPITYYYPTFQADLPGALKEISGLDSLGGRWWAHADSDNENLFYSIDVESGDILQEVKLKDAQNRDWEDLTTDQGHIYIADLGNNDNDRQNLGFYKVPLTDIGNDNTETVNDNEYDWLPLVYEDQFDFSTQPEDSTVFDCEAVLHFGGKLHVFTKNRKQQSTTHYVLNESTGIANKIETLQTQGLITGVDISPDGKLIALLGYKTTGVPSVFCYLLWDWHDGLFFNGNKRRIELGTAFQTGQAEAIAFADNRSGYLVNELTQFGGTTFVEESIQRFDFNAFVSTGVGIESPPIHSLQISIAPNPFSDAVSIVLGDENDQLVSCTVRNTLGQIIAVTTHDFVFQTATWPSGHYVFQVQTANGGTLTTILQKTKSF